jgi:ActR/RegA family two-component response regulator
VEYVSLLVVEDDKTEVREWEKEVERHNVGKDKPFEIEVTFADSKLTAERMIQTRRFDAAVVDLRLKLEGTGQGHNDDGNDVVRTLAAGEMAAVAVFTGQRAEVEKFDSQNIEILDKGDGLDVAFKWLARQSEIILAVRKAGKIIGNDMALTFHRSIWPRWQQWHQIVDGSKNVELPLARHLVSHVYTQLLQRSEKVHPEEHYYVPPIPNSEISTGDLILNSSSEIEVIITPRCDAAHPGKTNTLQLAACMDISKEWKRLSEANTPANQGTIKQWKQHDRKEVQHFIPAMTLERGKSLGPWFVRFDRIRSIYLESEEYKDLKKLRFASISYDFLPSLVQRLGAFFSRIGTPDM